METTNFKPGDRVKYKESHKGVAELNGHVFDKIYTISTIIDRTRIAYFKESEFTCLIDRLELVDANRHPNFDLIVTWANDRTTRFQYLYYGEWRDVVGVPLWEERDVQYRVKPKTKKITRYNWVVSCNGILQITSDKHTEEELRAIYSSDTFQKIDWTAELFEVEV